MHKLKKEFLDFISNPEFPCLGAKAAAKKNCVDLLVAEDLASSSDDASILLMLYKFIQDWKENKDYLQTACVLFKKPLSETETQFETLLWDRLQKLHALDSEFNLWDKEVSSDVGDVDFSFSIGGYAFFVVGLHSQSSRKARQFKYPALVFNLHTQFDLLREEGIFTKMRDKIREEDNKYSGSVNPMVHDFGDASEAIQYSGRKVSLNYECPFKKETNIDKHWHTISPCSGKAFILEKGDFLIVQDYEGQQVADLYCFAKDNSQEFLSSGKSIDYNNTLHFSTQNKLYSNQSNFMLSIEYDEVGVHDFLFAPCDKNTFDRLYDNLNPRTGCYEHLEQAFAAFGINTPIHTTFNIFMHVTVNKSGRLKIEVPKSKKRDLIVFKSHMDLIVGLTACSAPKTNNYSLKPIRYKIISGAQSKIKE